MHRTTRSSSLLIPILVLLVASGGVLAGGSPGKIVDRFFAAYRAGDVERMLDLYAADATFEDVAQRHSFTGTEQIGAMLSGIAQLHHEMNLVEKRRTIDGDTVVVEFVYEGKLNGVALSQMAGKEGCPDLDYSLPVTGWYTVRDGKIVSQRDYIDFATYLELREKIQSAGNGS